MSHIKTCPTEIQKYQPNGQAMQKLPQPSLESLKKKLKFYEQDLIQLRQHNKDLETSLLINKQLIETLIRSSNLSDDIHKVIDQLKADNQNLYSSLKVSYEERQKNSTQILLLEQINNEHREKERENQKQYQEQILNMKEQMEKKNYLIEIKNRYFSELLVLSKQNISQQDRTAMAKLQDLLKNKQNAEQNALGTMNIQSVISEKERLANELESAMGQIDKLRSLLAENTLNTLFTVPDHDHSVMIGGSGGHKFDKFHFKDVVEGVGNVNESTIDNKVSKSFTTFNNIGGFNKGGSKKVPGLDFSNLKQVKDFKDWYSYAKKLEDAIRLLRETISMMEKEAVESEFKYQKLLSQFDQMTNLNVQLTEKISSQKRQMKAISLQSCKQCGAIQSLNCQYDWSDLSQDGGANKSGDDRSGKRIAKRNKSQVTFVKKNLTLEIEKINKEMENKQKQQEQQMMDEMTASPSNIGNTTFNKKGMSDSQEDSPIRY